MFSRNPILNVVIKTVFLFLDIVWFRKDPNLWLIAVPDTDRFDGNVRYLYEKCKEDYDLIKPVSLHVILAECGDVCSSGAEIIRWGGLQHLTYTIRAGCILYHHNYNDIGLWAIPLWRKNIRLSHGIHYKAVERANSIPSFSQRFVFSTKNMIPYHLVSSKLDALSAVAYFHIYLPTIRITGSAKNDIINSNTLPQYYKDQEEVLLDLLEGRGLITYAPTWRDHGASYKFDQCQISKLSNYLDANNYVMGVAGHKYLRERFVPEERNFIDLNKYSIDIQVVLRNTEILISDYSSIWIDFLLRDRAIILFRYDMQNYLNSRDLLFDDDLLDELIVTDDFESLVFELDRVDMYAQGYPFLKNVFHKYKDGKNCSRTIEAIKNIVSS